jgi:hypothetical protein
MSNRLTLRQQYERTQLEKLDEAEANDQDVNPLNYIVAATTIVLEICGVVLVLQDRGSAPIFIACIALTPPILILGMALLVANKSAVPKAKENLIRRYQDMLSPRSRSVNNN